jgi:hypothetical protein
LRLALAFGLILLPVVAGTAPAAGGAQEGLDPALKRALERKQWSDLRLDAECATDAGPNSVTVYGNGVGIWNGQRQFAADREHVSALLRAFLRAGFADLREMYGGKEDPRTPRTVLKVVCSVSLALGGVVKRVTQLEGGTQSPQLAQLAREVLDLCEGPGRTGVTAAGVSDGLRRVAAGELAPETLSVTLHRKLEGPGGPGLEGFLLRVAGRRVETRTHGKAAGYSNPATLELEAEDLAGLARALAEADPDALPVNLYAPHYTDLAIEVLGHEVTVQARRFAGLEPTTHGEKQAAFDRAFERLRQLHRRALQAGKPRAAPAD